MGDCQPDAKEEKGSMVKRIFSERPDASARCARHVLAMWLGLSLAAMGFSADAAEYFVNKQGNDGNHGQNKDKAFATIQKGLDAIRTGDTLTIGPGEYFEHVTRTDLGGPDADTVIRSEVPGMAILHGDVPAPALRKLDGYRFVYAADLPSEPEAQAVLELDTLKVFRRSPSVAELEFSPGCFFHDRAAGRLYVSTADMAPPGKRSYTLCVSTNSGIELTRPRRVRLEGLALIGFKERGILMIEPDACVITDCRACFNARGGIHVQEDYWRGKTGGNVIERCVAWANGGVGLMVNQPRRDTIRDSTSFLNEGIGLEMYNGNSSRLENSLSWGNGQDFLLKQGAITSVHQIERCVMPGLWGHETHSDFVLHAIAGRINGNAGRRFFKNSVILDDVKSLNRDSEFADPKNHDYRLQATSRFRGAGADGTDLGPFSFETNIFYVATNGDDRADGLSASHAWASPSRAASGLRPGDTLYVVPGRYEGALRLTVGKPAGGMIFIRGRGTGLVELAGDVRLENCHNLTFERLRFTGPVTASGGGNIVFEQCAFGSSDPLYARGVEGLRLVQSAFSGRGQAQVSLSGCVKAFLAGNLFENSVGTAVSADQPESVLYADHNGYWEPSKAWRLDGREVALARLPGGMERYGAALKAGGMAFAGNGLYRRPAGNYSADPGECARVAGPFVHSIGTASADIEWFASRSVVRKEWDQPNAKVEIAWGKTAECSESKMVDTDCFGSFSLVGLEPSTLYYVKLRKVMPASKLRERTSLEWNREALSFTTLKRAPAPATYYVSPKGEDKNTGLEPGLALRTLNRAAALVRPGDTVRIGGGVYRERLCVRATGTAERPITFAAVPGERVELNGDRKALNCLLLSLYKSHLRFDGLHLLSISSVTPWDGGAIRLFGGQDIRLTRIFFDGRPGYSPTFLYAAGVRDLLVRNCVSIHSGGFSPRIMACPSFRMENSLNIHNLIGGMYLDKPRDGKYVLRNNIFTDCQENKIHVGIGPLASSERMLLANNAWFLRPNRQYQGDEGTVTARVSMADFKVMVARDNGLLGDPRFAVLYRNGADPDSGIGKGFTVEHLIGEDAAYSNLTFRDLFATNPEFVKKEIGLNPRDFDDYYAAPASAAEPK